MNIESKTISWLVLIIGLLLYFWNISVNEFSYATISMAITMIIWLSISFYTNSFNNIHFAQILSVSGFLLAISVFFLYGLEEMPYPTGAIVFHSDGIAKALGLVIIASLPILFGFTNSTGNNDTNDISKNKKDPTFILDDDEFELANENDLTSGEFDI